ncbi:hypothetical protein [Desulforhabdus amnigena]|jgi:hypothetical protein|uniref:Uncharacterized protein n=1 Tax=Desulforhabdus amnigena TaxID=40218 RepID=A0A9W6D428_9BACT|nr:hypothetical protein [Desulforhabdus amnigena]GLI33775.1 hypothetical protein DAMNIGENAA_12080 [Desulforhabdus amnigena]
MLMTVNMGFCLMAGMVMIVRPVFPRVLMIMYLGSAAMGVLMEVFMQVLMSVGMCVFMSVNLPVMGMLMGMRVLVCMSMQMLVFVFSFHDNPPSPSSLGFRCSS